MPLSDLCAALVAATGPSRELDERIATEVFGWRRVDPAVWSEWLLPPNDLRGRTERLPAYTSSLDAITGALEQRWPEENWCVYNTGAAYLSLEVVQVPLDRRRTPALALCLAAARLAEAEAADAR